MWSIDRGTFVRVHEGIHAEEYLAHHCAKPKEYHEWHECRGDFFAGAKDALPELLCIGQDQHQIQEANRGEDAEAQPLIVLRERAQERCMFRASTTCEATGERQLHGNNEDKKP